MIEVGGVFNRNNESRAYNRLGWNCEICKERLTVPMNTYRYLQFEDNKVCPRCKTRYNVTSIVMWDN